MCLIRNIGMLVVALAALAVTGCQMGTNKAVRADLDNRPLIVDEAMQHRNWDRMACHYANGATIAGPDLVVIRSSGLAEYQRVTDPAIATANDTVIPITTFLAPPWKDVTYRGVVVPPTYSAQPAPHVIK